MNKAAQSRGDQHRELVLLPQIFAYLPQGLRASTYGHNCNLPAAPPAPACIGVGKVYYNHLMLGKNHETEREVVCLKQYNQLVLESEQKASVRTLPQSYSKQL